MRLAGSSQRLGAELRLLQRQLLYLVALRSQCDDPLARPKPGKVSHESLEVRGGSIHSKRLLKTGTWVRLLTRAARQVPTNQHAQSEPRPRGSGRQRQRDSGNSNCSDLERRLSDPFLSFVRLPDQGLARNVRLDLPPDDLCYQFPESGSGDTGAAFRVAGPNAEARDAAVHTRSKAC